MSYGLQLWRQTGTITLGWDELWEALTAGEAVPFVAPLQADEIVTTLRRTFPEIRAADWGIEWEGEGSYFHIHYTRRGPREISSLEFSCGFSLPTATLERFFEAARELKLTVYDGQGPTVFYPIGSACRPATWWERLRRAKWDEQPG